MSALTWAGVAVFGGLGAVARFLLDGWIGSKSAGDLPLGTLAVNLSGAFLLGLLVGLAAHGDLLILAGAATLGAYTTFSTWMLETDRLGESSQLPGAALNIIVSLTAGLGAVALGRLIGAHI